MSTIDLDRFRDKIVAWYTALAVPGAPHGTYRFGPGLDPGFYASADMAILRWVIGEDLRAIPNDARSEWCSVINGHQHPGGWYGPEMNHHILHANGTATNALCAIGGKYRYPVPYYSLFNTPERIVPWLSQIDWTNPWSASHLVWGGPALWANSKWATQAWRESCLKWLDDELNEFGAWPKSFPTLQGGKIAPIGNARSTFGPSTATSASKCLGSMR